MCLELISEDMVLYHMKESDHMKAKRFTDEEMAALRDNPYTYKVTPCQLHFTAEFKEHFWKEYCSGSTPREILKDCGYDTEVLGESRICGIQMHIREAAKAGEAFHSGSLPRQIKARSDHAEPKSQEEELRQLKTEVQYLRKEMDFLKKISSVRTSGKQVKS